MRCCGRPLLDARSPSSEVSVRVGVAGDQPRERARAVLIEPSESFGFAQCVQVEDDAFCVAVCISARAASVTGPTWAAVIRLSVPVTARS